MRKPKSSNVLPQKKNFVKSVRKQYGNPDSHPFLPLFCEQIRYTILNITKKIVKFSLRHNILSNCFVKNRKLPLYPWVIEFFGNISLENLLRIGIMKWSV